MKRQALFGGVVEATQLPPAERPVVGEARVLRLEAAVGQQPLEQIPELVGDARLGGLDGLPGTFARLPVGPLQYELYLRDGEGLSVELYREATLELVELVSQRSLLCLHSDIRLGEESCVAAPRLQQLLLIRRWGVALERQQPFLEPLGGPLHLGEDLQQELQVGRFGRPVGRVLVLGPVQSGLLLVDICFEFAPTPEPGFDPFDLEVAV